MGVPRSFWPGAAVGDCDWVWAASTMDLTMKFGPLPM